MVRRLFLRILPGLAVPPAVGAAPSPAAGSEVVIRAPGTYTVETRPAGPRLVRTGPAPGMIDPDAIGRWVEIVARRYRAAGLPPAEVIARTRREVVVTRGAAASWPESREAREAGWTAAWMFNESTVAVGFIP